MTYLRGPISDRDFPGYDVICKYCAGHHMQTADVVTALLRYSTSHFVQRTAVLKMPFLGQDWRSPGGQWVRTDTGWEHLGLWRWKLLESLNENVLGR